MCFHWFIWLFLWQCKFYDFAYNSSVDIWRQIKKKISTSVLAPSMYLWVDNMELEIRTSPMWVKVPPLILSMINWLKRSFLDHYDAKFSLYKKKFWYQLMMSAMGMGSENDTDYVNKSKQSEPALKTTTYDLTHHLLNREGISFLPMPKIF